MATLAEPHQSTKMATVSAARQDARAQAGGIAEAMPYVPASSSPYVPDGVPA